VLGLIDQHREMERIVEELGRSRGDELERRLVALGTVLEAHIRTEERELFEMMQARLSPEFLAGLGADVERTRRAG
jgi:hypothetical protein